MAFLFLNSFYFFFSISIYSSSYSSFILAFASNSNFYFYFYLFTNSLAASDFCFFTLLSSSSFYFSNRSCCSFFCWIIFSISFFFSFCLSRAAFSAFLRSCSWSSWTCSLPSSCFYLASYADFYSLRALLDDYWRLLNFKSRFICSSRSLSSFSLRAAKT